MLAHAAGAARLMLNNESGVQFTVAEDAAVPARAWHCSRVRVAAQMQALGLGGRLATELAAEAEVSRVEKKEQWILTAGLSGEEEKRVEGYAEYLCRQTNLQRWRSRATRDPRGARKEPHPQGVSPEEGQ